MALDFVVSICAFEICTTSVLPINEAECEDRCGNLWKHVRVPSTRMDQSVFEAFKFPLQFGSDLLCNGVEILSEGIGENTSFRSVYM